MEHETVVAIFDSKEHAAAAVRDLEQAGIAASDITQHAGSSAGGASAQAGLQSGAQTRATGEHQEERGFWSSLFGAEPEYGHDTAVYDRSLEGGSTVVTIRGSSQNMDRVLDILERHNPIDIDERAADYGVAATRSDATSGSTRASQSSTGNLTGAGLNTTQDRAGGGLAQGRSEGRTEAGTAGGTTSDRTPGTLSLSEETLQVGKRAVNRGTTRVRRYVVETPVEERVNLRDETVSVERRPVTGDRAASNAEFTDKTIELTETSEEPVVSKTARVREEVVIRKDATDRTETVRDTVRREDVEITKDTDASGHATVGVSGRPGSAGTASASPTSKPKI